MVKEKKSCNKMLVSYQPKTALMLRPLFEVLSLQLFFFYVRLNGLLQSPCRHHFLALQAPFEISCGPSCESSSNAAGPGSHKAHIEAALPAGHIRIKVDRMILKKTYSVITYHDFILGFIAGEQMILDPHKRRKALGVASIATDLLHLCKSLSCQFIFFFFGEFLTLSLRSGN